LLKFDKFLFGLHRKVYIYFIEETTVRQYSFNSYQYGRITKFNRNPFSNFRDEICGFVYAHNLSAVHFFLWVIYTAHTKIL